MDGNTTDQSGGWMEKESIERDYWKGGHFRIEQKRGTKNSPRNLHG